MSTDRVIVGSSVRNLEDSPAYAAITKVRVFSGENSQGEQIIYEYPTRGGDNGRILDVEIPWGSAEVAKNIYAAVSGYAYKPYSAEDAIADPVAEIGDAILIDDVYSVIAETDTELSSPLMNAHIRAREDGTIDHEYPYISPENRDIKRALTENKTALIVQEGKITTIVQEIGTVDTDNGTIVSRLSKVEQTADGVSLYIEKSEGPLYNKIASQAGTVAQGKVDSWASVNFKADKISTVLGKTYATPTEVTTAKNDAISTAKAYTNGEIQTVKNSYESEISQTADSIKLSVASAQSKWDLDELKKNWNVTISKFGFSAPSDTNSSSNPLRPSNFKNKYYLDQTTGFIYKSTGSGSSWSWKKQDNMSSDAANKEKALKLITANLSSRITITEKSISSVVTEDDLSQAKSEILQEARSIRMSVSPTRDAYGQLTGGTTFSLSDNNAVLQTQEFNVAVDVANIHGTLKANSIEANTSIQSPTITGGTINSTTLNSTNINSSTIYSAVIKSASLYSPVLYASEYDTWRTWFSIGSSNSGYGLQLGNTYGNIFRIYNSTSSNSITLGANNPAFDFMSIGGNKVNLYGTWDFRSCTNVILPS